MEFVLSFGGVVSVEMGLASFSRSGNAASHIRRMNLPGPGEPSEISLVIPYLLGSRKKSHGHSGLPVTPASAEAPRNFTPGWKPKHTEMKNINYSRYKNSSDKPCDHEFLVGLTKWPLRGMIQMGYLELPLKFK